MGIWDGLGTNAVSLHFSSSSSFSSPIWGDTARCKSLFKYDGGFGLTVATQGGVLAAYREYLMGLRVYLCGLLRGFYHPCSFFLEHLRAPSLFAYTFYVLSTLRLNLFIACGDCFLLIVMGEGCFMWV